MNKERLLNVAKALRESPNPDDFTMGQYVNHCGTPACALGHYAARTDLQSLLVIKQIDADDATSRTSEDFDLVYARSGKEVDFDDEAILEHFDISVEDADLLFGPEGCSDAQTATDAAECIEHFVAEDFEIQS